MSVNVNKVSKLTILTAVLILLVEVLKNLVESEDIIYNEDDIFY